MNKKHSASKDEVTIEEIMQMKQKMEAADDAAFQNAVRHKRADRNRKLYGKYNPPKHHSERTESSITDDRSAKEAAAVNDSITPADTVDACFSTITDTDENISTFAPMETADADKEPIDLQETVYMPITEQTDVPIPNGNTAHSKKEFSQASLFGDIDSSEYSDSANDSDDGASVAKDKIIDNKSPKRKSKHLLWIPLGFVLLVIFGYLTFVFVPIPFVRKLRDGYIGTAMTTGDHQWLATMFIPYSIIEEVMGDIIDPPEHPDDSDLTDLIIKKPDSEAETEQNEYTTAEKDTEKTPETDKNNPNTPNPKPKPSDPDILGLSSLKVGSVDYAGYKVIMIDKEEGLYVSRITGTGFEGYAMLIDDPSRVFVGTTPEKTKRGYRINEMMDYYGDVIAGINASGFADPDDQGSGCDIIGYCMSEGVGWGTYTSTMTSIVLTNENKLVVGWVSDWEQYNIRDGMQFGPALIKNGENQINGGGGYGWHPRTAIGQREDGAIIFLVIDGRSVTSIGCQIGDLSAIMLKYKAINAGCCDGGSSVVLAYDGKILNQNSSANPDYGRRLPNAFLVHSKKTWSVEK